MSLCNFYHNKIPIKAYGFLPSFLGRLIWFKDVVFSVFIFFLESISFDVNKNFCFFITVVDKSFVAHVWFTMILSSRVCWLQTVVCVDGVGIEGESALISPFKKRTWPLYIGFRHKFYNADKRFIWTTLFFAQGV